MKKTLSLLMLSFLLIGAFAGCGEDRSYASILMIGNQTFIGNGRVSQDQYGNVQQIGTVVRKVNADEWPNENFSSNELPEGTELYRVDDYGKAG